MDVVTLSRLVLGAAVPDRPDRLTAVAQHLGPRHFQDPTVKWLLRYFTRFARKQQPEVMSREQLAEELEKDRRVDSGNAALLLETYDALAELEVTDDEFASYFRELQEQVAAMVPSGSRLLDEVHEFLGRFVAYPSVYAHVAHTLWVAHTHAMDAWESTPRIAFLSPEPGSGKTRCLEAMELLVPRPVEAVNVTPAYLFRKVGDVEGRPTILYDEIDTVFGPKAKDNEEIRGLLNAGHRRNAVAGRCATYGKTIVPEEIPAFCAVALAGLGGLPDTLLSRAVVVRMRRRSLSEPVVPFRRKLNETEGHGLRDRLEVWAEMVGKLLEDEPPMPEGIEDRDADVWEALLAVADAAGGHWPGIARVAAVALVTESKQSTPSLGVRLLADLRDVFGDHEVMATEPLLGKLCALEESPWADLRGKPLNARGLAQRLRQYEVKSTNVRIGEQVVKGYKREDLWDAWERYLGPAHLGSATSATSDTSQVSRGAKDATSDAKDKPLTSNATDVADVAPPKAAGPPDGTGPKLSLAQMQKYATTKEATA